MTRVAALRKASERCAVYVRISKDSAGDELGVRRQLKACEELAQRRGWPVAEVFSDDDIGASRYSTKKRPGFEALMAAVEARQVNVVIAWDLDRITRRPLEAEQMWSKLMELGGVRVTTVGGDDIDLSPDGDGLMVARIKMAVAAEEVKKMSGRLRSKHDQLAADGKWQGGRAPYGYALDGAGGLEVAPVEAAIVAEAAKRVLAGESIHALLVDFANRGLPPVAGQRWHRSTLRAMLISPTLTGRRVHLGEDVGKAQWDGIISTADQQRLIAILDDPGRVGTRVARTNLLAGLVVCSLCGSKMEGNHRTVKKARADGTKRPAYRIYSCSKVNMGGCGRQTVSASGLEELVIEAVLTALDGPGLAAAMAPGDEVDPAATELAEVERRLAEVTDMYSAGELDRAGLIRARSGLEARRTVARATLTKRSSRAALEPYRASEGGLRAAWPEMTFDQRRAVLTATIDRVIVDPATRARKVFDPSRVNPKTGLIWKV